LRIDFVARTDEFKALPKKLPCRLRHQSSGLTADGIDPAIIEREKEIARNKALNDGKKAEIVEKIVEGNIKKYCSEHALMEQGLIANEKMTVKELLTNAIAKTGENIQVARFVRYSLGE
jgi:elongation factor Ts